MRVLIIYCVGFLSFPAFALETDNFLVWSRTLKDSSAHINRYFSENITAALDEISDHENLKCHDITTLIAKRFASRLVHDNPVENYLFSVLGQDEIFPSHLNYVDESIYRDPYRFYIPWFGLAPNIQVNGYYFGTDKLSHFASTGMQYYQIYIRELGVKRSPAKALMKAIHWGILDEKSVHGYLSSGILSYADLESNYQGLKFYQDFCQAEKPFLQKNISGRWQLINKPDIRKYVNGYWDETFEPSYLLPGNWKKVKTVIKDQYCGMSFSQEVSGRMHYYRTTSRPSVSVTYLNNLKKTDKLPDPESSQSIHQLCLQ